MSHHKERIEKICLNCNAALHGRFCHVCGQENVEPKHSVWELITHFFNDITHFDGKFFSTTGLLFARPGFLPREYMLGRRASYLNPIRMYIFSSAFFFLIFFSLFSAKNLEFKGRDVEVTAAIPEEAMIKAKQVALKEAETKQDSLEVETQFTALGVEPDTAAGRDVPVKDTVRIMDSKGMKWHLTSKAEKYTSRKQYDSLQKSLPPDRRDGWFKRRVVLREIDLKAQYGSNEKQMLIDMLDKFMHTFPYLLFVSLPLYALFLKILYVRRRQYYYTDHGMFLVYLYIFTFLFLLIFFGVIKLKETTGWGWLGWIEAAMIIYGIYYAFRAMRKFYAQGWWKTFVKFLLLNLLSVISITLLFGLFFILTVLL